MNTATIAPSAPLRAFHGKAEVKEKFLRRVRAHRAADEIVSGQYWENGKGCAVGCTIHGHWHSDYEHELGIPRRLAYLEDRYFERLYEIDPFRAKEWPERFLQAPAIGADLSLVWPRFAYWILLDADHGAIRAAKSDKIFAAVTNVGNLYKRWIESGVRPPLEDFAEAAREVRGYRFYWRYDVVAAVAAAVAAVAADADADADAAAAVARRRYSAVWREAYNARIILGSDKLIELISTAPVPTA